MSYKPPFARMRTIKKNAGPPLSHHPQQNVEDALAEARALQDAGKEVASEIRVPVGIVDVVVTPGPDKTYGTEDDKVEIVKAQNPTPEIAVEEIAVPVIEPEVAEIIEEIIEEPEPVVVEEVVEEVVEPKKVKKAKAKKAKVKKAKKPVYDMTMRRNKLAAVAKSVGLSTEGTKKEIIKRLDAYCK